VHHEVDRHAWQGGVRGSSRAGRSRSIAVFERVLIVLDARQPADALVRRGTHLVRPGAGVLLRHASEPCDSAASVLNAVAVHRCQAIIVGERPDSWGPRLWSRGMAQRLVRDSRVPVLVCPPGDTGEVRSGEGFLRLLITLDDARCVSATVRLSLALARAWCAELVFTRVKPSPYLPAIDPAGVVAGLPPGWVEDEEARAERALAWAVAQAGRAGLPASGVCLPAGTTARALPRIARDFDCDLFIAARRAGSAPPPGRLGAAAVPVLNCVVADDLMPTAAHWPR
jgi:nucleotide-binding universal stress UspA family protein